MSDAAANDEDVADFVYRANNWEEAWAAELVAAGDAMWPTGCGWDE